MSLYRVPGVLPPDARPDEAGAVADLRRTVKTVKIGVLLPLLLASVIGTVPTLQGYDRAPLWQVVSCLLPIPPGLALYQVAMLLARVRWRRRAASEHHLNASAIRSLERMYGGR